MSITIHTAYSQTCTNTHSQSTFLSVSINGPSINKIGKSKYIDIIKIAAQTIIQSSGSNRYVGLQSFGGITVNGIPTESVFTEQTLTQGDYTTIETILNNLPTTRDFDNNYGNDVASAFDGIISQSWNGQRYHILFAAGNPLRNGFGTSTIPGNFDNPCANAVRAKQNNIQTYVVLIGTPGINYIKQFYSCLVEDTSTDIIEIDPDSPTNGINKLKSRVCKEDGIDFKITEVNPIDGTFRRYIEVLNLGKPTSISVCFNQSPNTCATSMQTGTGQYYVGYGGSNGIVPSSGANIVVASGLGASAGSANWIATASSGTITDTVSYDNTFQKQVTSPQTRSYALRAVGFNNKYGMNWRMTCGDIGGTPGYPPLDTCVAGGTCTTDTCSATSIRSEQCDINSNYCQCDTSLYFSDGDTCINKPTVSNTTCQGYVIFDENANRDYTYFVWSLPYDGIVSYNTQYNTNQGGNIQKDTDSPVVPADYLRDSELSSGSASIIVQTIVNSPVGSQQSITSTTLTCPINTLEPTISPTTNPTLSASKLPTGVPTKNPTYDDPGVYIGEKGGVCSLPRCNCFQEIRTCCFPFGPKYGSDMTSGYVPNGGCENIFKSVEITAAQQKTRLTQSIYINKYGDTEETNVYYRITALGQINETEFRNLSHWTSYYDSETWRRRLGEGNGVYDVDTPAPTTLYGNRLNIGVTPPGKNTIYTDMVTIPAGSGEIPLDLNISAGLLKCARGDDCVTEEECRETAMGFELILLNCAPWTGTNCAPLYPTTLWISVTRSPELCVWLYPSDGNENEWSSWLWPVLIAFIIFVLVLTLLIYRFWWKQKKIAKELDDKQSELVEQENELVEGITKDLDVGDVMFNQLATGVPGPNRPYNAIDNQLYQNEVDGQNDFVQVDAEIFQVRTVLGPKMTDYTDF